MEKEYLPVELENGRSFEVVPLRMGQVNDLCTQLIGNPVNLVFGIPASFLRFAIKDCPELGDETPFQEISDVVEAFERVNPTIEGRLERMITLK